MELGRIKDQFNAILDQMEKIEDKSSQEYEYLQKRLEQMGKLIQDEESRRENNGREDDIRYRELAIREAELEDKKKDRVVKVLFGVGTGVIAVASIFADETRVVCKTGLEIVDKVIKISKY